MEWDKYFLQLADKVSEKSKDPSTKVGCVIAGRENNVLSTGFNGFAMGVDESKEERWERPQKYEFISHSERNAIYLASRHGTKLKGSKMYINKKAICMDCGIAIIQAGIEVVTVPKGGEMRDKWMEDMKKVRLMFNEAGILLRERSF